MNLGVYRNLGLLVLTVFLPLLSFYCTNCDEEFGNEEALKEHEENHTDEEQLKCIKCGKKMVKKEILIEEEAEVARI